MPKGPLRRVLGMQICLTKKKTSLSNSPLSFSSGQQPFKPVVRRYRSMGPPVSFLGPVSIALLSFLGPVARRLHPGPPGWKMDRFQYQQSNSNFHSCPGHRCRTLSRAKPRYSSNLALEPGPKSWPGNGPFQGLGQAPEGRGLSEMGQGLRPRLIR